MPRHSHKSAAPAILALACAALLAGCAGAGFDRAASQANSTPRAASPPAPRSRPSAGSAPLASLPAASRLLDQATFGPTAGDVQHVQSVGLDAYLTEQLNTAPTPMLFRSNAPNKYVEGQFFTLALTAPDQLRQRVAFALSEMFVVSDVAIPAEEVITYHNMLARDAFGNFSTLLKDVTLSPAMGDYLNMLNSAVPADGELANENFARELMQLFALGLYQLNPDGTPILDKYGSPIPVYSADHVQAFARAYTGWTYAAADGSAATTFPNPTMNASSPMAPVASAHDFGSKTLLNGTVLPPGQTPQQDLDAALANVFAHPNVGPFVCRQLIQHLVMSDPSPAYVARVAAVFADNGSGVRGDMTAVLRAILLDRKARAGDAGPVFIDGHLREPILYLTAVYRALGFSGNTINLRYLAGEIGQQPYESPSVFNYFPPDYIIPNAQNYGSSINAPEFAIENTATAQARLSIADQIVSSTFDASVIAPGDPLTVDLSASSPLGTLAANAPDLIDALSVMFLHGQMPADMRQLLIDHVNTLSDPAQRARVATFLVISSSQYKDLH